MKLSTRSLNSPPSGIREMFELAKDYDNVVNLCIGEPGFTTPGNIINAAKKALDDGYTKYTSNAGVIELRRALARKFKIDNGIDADPDNSLIVTTGAGEAIILTLLALINDGDEIIIPDPSWPNYLGHIATAGGKVVPVTTYEEDGFILKADAVKKAVTDKTKVIIVNSPSNPTGAVMTKEELIEIGKIAKENDIIVISDEPYEKIIYDGLTHFSLASLEEFKDNVVTINSFSKTYAMTGWRVGYANGPQHIIKAMVKLQENLSSCVNSVAQQACIEAISGKQDAVHKMVEEYKSRRNILIKGLNELEGVSCIVPKGAFYAFANIKALDMSSEDAAKAIIKEVQVVTTPGSAFGSAGEGYLRLSFASNTEDIIEALSRFKKCSLFNK
jgi:aspartate/methionine/tyrosine aminotransferase